jgi:cardiolipin synthase
LPEGFGGYIALEAWRSETGLSLKYVGPDGLVYSSADWAGEIDENIPIPDGVSLVVVNPDLTGREPWVGRAETARRVPVLQARDYWRLRNELLAAIVPNSGTEAITVALGDEEIILYFDGDGRFQSIIGEPPDGIRVVQRYSLEEYLNRAPERLEELLADLGMSTTEVLFNTGDVGEDALPFLYANVDARVGAFIRVLPLGAQPVAHDTLVPVTQSIAHVLRSHSTALVQHPLSSLTRLMFAVTHAATDTFDSATLPLVEATPIPPLADAAGMDLATWETDLDRMTRRASDIGTIRYLIDGEAFFPRFEAAVRDAQHSVMMRTYIFDNDDYALAFADLLRERSGEGVDVKVLLDGIGYVSALAQPAFEQPEDYIPPLSMRWYLQSGSGVKVRLIANPFFMGDHTKTTVIDEKVAFLGGMNVAREYRYEWHDMMVELRGPIVARLADDFDLAWARAGILGDIASFFARLMPDRKAKPGEGYPIRVLYTRPTASEIRNTQLEAIRRAQRHIYLQNAYLTDDAFLLELVKARRRGVDVRVVIPLESDRGQLTRDNILAANTMFRNGIRVYIYPGMSHIKAAIFDGWACLGSANLDQLSLRVNLETNVATSDPAAVASLKQQLFDVDFAASPEMREAFPERWNDRLWEMVGDYFF